MIKDFPLYECVIEEKDDGFIAMSLVDFPATEVEWMAFSEQKEIQKYSIANKDEQIIYGVVMVADTPIFRRDEDGFEYYVTYSKDTLQKMAEKMINEDRCNQVDINHNGEILPKGKVALRELFIKDEKNGINPIGFENVKDGSLFCKYKVNDEQLWLQCKDGTFTGFSLAGFFTAKKCNKNKYTKMSKIKDALKKLLVEFASVKTDKAVLEYEDDVISVGTAVSVDGAVAADDVYTAEDGTVYVVKDGVVAEIREAEKEEEVKEEVKEDVKEEMAEEVPASEEVPAVEKEEIVEEVEDDKIKKLEEEIEILKADVEVLKQKIEEIISTPAVEPAVEEFKKVEQNEKKYEGKLGRMVAAASTLKK